MCFRNLPLYNRLRLHRGGELACGFTAKMGNWYLPMLMLAFQGPHRPWIRSFQFETPYHISNQLNRGVIHQSTIR